MRNTALLLSALMLPACQYMQSDDPSLLSFRVPEGSTLALNKEVNIPAGQTHVMFQSGRVTTASDRNLYHVSCRLNFRKFGPRTIQPEVFNIRRTEEREGWESRPNFYFYTTEIYLDTKKGTDILKMECSTWAMPPSFNFSYADIQQTLGDYFSFNFPQTDPTK